jgi:2-hydroxy-3-keto-5-methylthiopentenyl-1-phosphate phosphatase
MYTKILSQLNKKIKIQSLGKRSFFWAEKNGNVFQIINSKNKTYPVDLELFKLILERYKSLKIEIRFKTSQYTDPKWRDCPNRVASVYVAAIIRYYEN